MTIENTQSKFLYTILKQLDLKNVDWPQVAADLEITNGHAARMRYSRFKATMEGKDTRNRGPRSTSSTQTTRSKKTKARAKSNNKGADQVMGNTDAEPAPTGLAIKGELTDEAEGLMDTEPTFDTPTEPLSPSLIKKEEPTEF
ncbi:MAG: hypothetical protein M1829_001228 [Trizodia sp. TS-e1964]|nr:MAG: hypothetical protein M1829_001228 [Trizodia sp. TS-e1964]